MWVGQKTLSFRDSWHALGATVDQLKVSNQHDWGKLLVEVDALPFRPVPSVIVEGLWRVAMSYTGSQIKSMFCEASEHTTRREWRVETKGGPHPTLSSRERQRSSREHWANLWSRNTATRSAFHANKQLGPKSHTQPSWNPGNHHRETPNTALTPSTHCYTSTKAKTTKTKTPRSRTDSKQEPKKQTQRTTCTQTVPTT